MGIGKGPVRFGAFEFDFAAACLRRDGVRVQLSSQPAQVLAALVDRSGEVVTREELRFRLWGDSQFSDFEHGLNVAVAKVREALGDSAGEPQFVATVPRRGYRFLAAVTPSEATRPGRRPHRSWAAMAVGIAAVVLAASTAGDRQLRTFEDGYTGRIRLAVLPFENFSGNPQLEYICNGLTEELISSLGRLQPERLAVIAWTSAMRYKTIGHPIREIGRELDVDYVLQGSLLGDRISAQLTRVKDGRHLWADVYSSDLRGRLVLQSEIERNVARQARLTLVSSGAGDRPPDPRAHDEYLLGRYQWNKRNLEGYHKAIGHFEHAIAIDRTYAQAYAGLYIPASE
jgi:TolB-like protein/DNA-binding winged helix-turn-helix (wHTH) protein